MTKSVLIPGGGGGGTSAPAPVLSVDGRIGAVTLSDRYVDVGGDNMTGKLTVGGTKGIELNIGGRAAINAGPATTVLLTVGESAGPANFNSSAATVWGILTTPVNTGTSTVNAIEAVATLAGTGALGNSAAFLGWCNVTQAGATVPNLYSVVASGPGVAAGATVTDCYGVLINPQKVTGVTNGHGIDQRGANDVNTFAGPVRVGPTNSIELGNTSGGRVGIGSAAPTDAYLATGANLQWNSATTVQGIRGNIFNNGAGDVYGITTLTASVGCNALYAGMFQVRLFSGTGTINTAVGLYVNQPIITAGGTITSLTGLYINQQKVTGVTTGYGIWQQGANDLNVFQGRVTVGGSNGIELGLGSRMGIGYTSQTDRMLGLTGVGVPGAFNSSATVWGIAATPLNAGTGNIIGIEVSPWSENTGTVSAVIGLTAKMQAQATSGTITTARMLQADSPGVNTGATITTAIGLQINAQKVTGVTNGYGIWQSGANDFNYFVGNVGLGHSTPSAALQFADSKDIKFGTGAGTRIGTAGTEKLAFYGTTPVARPTGTPAAATDLATTTALANSLRASLIALGLVA